MLPFFCSNAGSIPKSVIECRPHRKNKEKEKSMYIVEGNIGAGKSTFITLLQQHLPTLSFALEPVDTWAHQNYGTSLLEEFYNDPKRWAFTIETLAMICRSRDYLSPQAQQPHHVMERSIYSGHYCFAFNGRQEGYFTEVEWDIYSHWVSFIFSHKTTPPNGFIYLRAEPEVCKERIAQRSRTGESGIPLEYLQQIHYWHDQFLLEKKNIDATIADVPVLVLDVTNDFVANPEAMKIHADAVNEFILQCGHLQKTTAKQRTID
jgi:deoxyadenosine/deoxycytidine kinase